MNGPTELTDPSPGRVPLWRNGLFLLGVLAAVEALAFAFMAWPGKETFDSLTTFADTGPYVQLAGDLLKTGAFQPNCRTVGYPLFLAPGLLLGEYHYYAIAAEMLLNLGLVAIFWRLLGHLQVGPKIKVLFAALFAVAGLGDGHLRAERFSGRVSVRPFRLRPFAQKVLDGALLGGLCLALCIVVRPAFMFLVPLMPVIAYLAGKFAARKLPLAHLGVYLGGGNIGPDGELRPGAGPAGQRDPARPPPSLHGRAHSQLSCIRISTRTSRTISGARSTPGESRKWEAGPMTFSPAYSRSGPPGNC